MILLRQQLDKDSESLTYHSPLQGNELVCMRFIYREEGAYRIAAYARKPRAVLVATSE